MEAIGSEVGQKMRSAIKAKLMELGCYVDDELPDYVMVMVANKRTRSQMEDDLQLFLTNNTEAFVCWLHQVLQKLQEVTINTNFVTNAKKTKEKRSVDASSLKKERKDKDKKKEKEKLKARLKLKAKKSKKEKEKKSDSKDAERTRPNVPPLFMNLEKESSPSITDVFAGQILKSHGIKSSTPVLLESEIAIKESSSLENEVKSRRKLLNRNRFPIIDPNTVSQISEPVKFSANVDKNQVEAFDILSIPDMERDNALAVLTGQPRAEKIKEINEINAKIQTLKKRLAEQLESGSEDEDFINLRTEAEELMGVDFNEDNSPSTPAVIPDIRTPPLIRVKSPEMPLEPSLTPVKPLSLPTKVVRELVKAPEMSPPQPLPELPQIELNLPKRPLRDRLGVRPKSVTVSSEGTLVTRTINMVNPYQSNKGNSKHDGGSSEKMHLDKLNKVSSNEKISVKSRLTLREEKERVQKKEDVSNKVETVIKRRIGSRVVPLPSQREEDPSVAVASIVRAPPRPAGLSGAPASQLLMRAVADAHKSLLSMPPKNNEAVPKKKALVLPMRRNVDPKKIIIEVSSDKVPTNPNMHERRNSNSDFEIDMDTESLGDLESDEENRNAGLEDACEYVPEPLGKKVANFKSIDYVPTHIKANNNRTDNPVISRILHFKTEKSDPSGKDPQFVVTLDGLDPNIFLEKKLGKEIQEDAQNKVGDSENNQIKTDDKEKQESAENISKSDSDDKINSNEITFAQKASDNPLHRTNIKISLTNLNNKNSLKTTVDSTNMNALSSDIKENLENKKSSGDIILSSDHSTSDLKTASGIKRKIETQQSVPFNHKDSFSPIIFHETENSKPPKHVSEPVDNNSSSKYDSLPSLPPDKKRKTSLTLNVRELKCRFFPDCRLGSACEFYHPPTVPASLSPVPACRAFPGCVFGDNCVYGHPVCKFDKSCTRKGCPYTHSKVLKTKTKLVNQSALAAPTSPVIASRVVPVSNYKSISATPLPPICKFYPNCSNPSCHFFHPKPCRFGKFCLNKIECNFYHHDTPNAKWTS